MSTPPTHPRTTTHLGQIEESLGDGNNILHLSNGINALMNCLCVLSTSTIQNLLDALNVTLRPLAIWLACNLNVPREVQFDIPALNRLTRHDGAYLANIGENNDGTDKEDGFLVHDVELV